MPLPSLVNAPIGYKLTACFSALDFINETSELLSITGLVLGFKAIEVKPECAAVFNPFSIVSLSS